MTTATHTTTAEPQQQPQPGRDSNGRFAHGNKGGPGNPFSRQVAALRQALLRAVTAQDMQDIALKLRQMALEGDKGAARLLLSYTLGKPAPAVEPDRLDIDEFQIYQEEVTSQQQLLAPSNSVPVALACELLRAILPGLIRDQFREFARLFALRFPQDMQRAAEAAGIDPLPDTPPQVAPSPVDTPAVAPAADARPAEAPPAPRQQQKRASRREAPRPSQPAAERALPSVDEILSRLRAGPDAALQAVLGGEQPGEAATVSKPGETGSRAANPGPSASAARQ